jgi:hypothetical protein
MSACGLPLLGDDANYGDIPGLIRTIALTMKRGKNVDFTGYWQPLPAMIPQGQIDDPDQSMNAKKRPQPGGGWSQSLQKSAGGGTDTKLMWVRNRPIPLNSRLEEWPVLEVKDWFTLPSPIYFFSYCRMSCRKLSAAVRLVARL